MSAIPLRVYAIRDGDALPSWWTTTNSRLFTRVGGNRESVLISELTWVAHGKADPELYGLFGDRKRLFTKNCM